MLKRLIGTMMLDAQNSARVGHLVFRAPSECNSIRVYASNYQEAGDGNGVASLLLYMTVDEAVHEGASHVADRRDAGFFDKTKLEIDQVFPLSPGTIYYFRAVYRSEGCKNGQQVLVGDVS